MGHAWKNRTTSCCRTNPCVSEQQKKWHVRRSEARTRTRAGRALKRAAGPNGTERNAQMAGLLPFVTRAISAILPVGNAMMHTRKRWIGDCKTSKHKPTILEKCPNY